MVERARDPLQDARRDPLHVGARNEHLLLHQARVGFGPQRAGLRHIGEARDRDLFMLGDAEELVEALALLLERDIIALFPSQKRLQGFSAGPMDDAAVADELGLRKPGDEIAGVDERALRRSPHHHHLVERDGFAVDRALERRPKRGPALDGLSDWHGRPRPRWRAGSQGGDAPSA
jgi:hypothetical protein